MQKENRKLNIELIRCNFRMRWFTWSHGRIFAAMRSAIQRSVASRLLLRSGIRFFSGLCSVWTRTHTAVCTVSKCDYYHNVNFANFVSKMVTACMFLLLHTRLLTTYNFRYLSKNSSDCSKIVVMGLHCLQMGVLWRYARLLVPVQLSTVKREVRDLCILRLVHGFLQAAPMLLLQLSLLPSKWWLYASKHFK